MWNIIPTDQFTRDREWYEKKHPRELAAVLSNLNRYFTQLKAAKNSYCVQGGYVHTEGKGVLALDETGAGPSLQATRLYLFADERTKIVHLITIGNKDRQERDVILSHEFVAKTI